MQLKPVALQPGRVLPPLKPVAVQVTAPNRASYKLLPSPLPTTCNVQRMGHRPCLAARTKAADDDAEAQAPAKEGEEAAVPERGRGERSMAYQLFAAIYVCAYVFSWRIGELIYLNAQDALESVRGYVLEKFSKKR